MYAAAYQDLAPGTQCALHTDPCHAAARPPRVAVGRVHWMRLK